MKDVLFDCPYAACIHPRCLTEGGTAVCYPLCAAEDWRVRQDIARRAPVRPRATKDVRRKDLEQL